MSCRLGHHVQTVLGLTRAFLVFVIFRHRHDAGSDHSTQEGNLARPVARRRHLASLFRRNTFFHESVTSHQKTKAPIATSVPRISSIFLMRNVELI